MQTSQLENNPDPARIARLIPQHSTLVAEQAGVIAGFVDAFVTVALDGLARWEVDLLGVDPQWRNRGIARQLVLASLRAALSLDLRYARALIRTDNYPSQRAFAWCGFAPQSIPSVLYVGEPVTAPAPSLPDGARLVTVETFTYGGVWIEGAFSAASFQAARALIFQRSHTTAGAVIRQDDSLAIEAAERAGFVPVGEFDWWERTTADAV